MVACFIFLGAPKITTLSNQANVIKLSETGVHVNLLLLKLYRMYA